MRKINKTQKRIIAAAKKEYALNGYSSTSFQAIAERSKTSKSLINYYFPKKQDILITALGLHLEEISDYLLGLHKYDSLMRLFLLRAIYYISFLQDATWLEFNNDIKERVEKELSMYRNHFFLFEDIAAEFPVQYSGDELFRVSISVYGLTKQLINSYLNGDFPNTTLREVIEQILWDTSSMLQLNNYIVHNYISRLWDEFDLLPKKIFLFFKEDEDDEDGDVEEEEDEQVTIARNKAVKELEDTGYDPDDPDLRDDYFVEDPDFGEARTYRVREGLDLEDRDFGQVEMYRHRDSLDIESRDFGQPELRRKRAGKDNAGNNRQGESDDDGSDDDNDD